jgi:hypothetical protein
MDEPWMPTIWRAQVQVDQMCEFDGYVILNEAKCGWCSLKVYT